MPSAVLGTFTQMDTTSEYCGTTWTRKSRICCWRRRQGIRYPSLFLLTPFLSGLMLLVKSSFVAHGDAHATPPPTPIYEYHPDIYETSNNNMLSWINNITRKFFSTKKFHEFSFTYLSYFIYLFIFFVHLLAWNLKRKKYISFISKMKIFFI